MQNGGTGKLRGGFWVEMGSSKFRGRDVVGSGQELGEKLPAMDIRASQVAMKE